MLRIGWMGLWKEGGTVRFPPRSLMVPAATILIPLCLPYLSLSVAWSVGQPRSGDRDLNFSSKTQQADEDKRRRRKIRITDHLSSRIHLLFGVCSSKFSLGLSLMQLLEAGAIVAEKLLSCELILRDVRSSFRLTLASQPAIFANGLKN